MNGDDKETAVKKLQRSKMLEQNKVPDEADLNESVEESESSIDPKILS